MNSRLLLADAHVHFYDCFDIEHLLDLASINFQKEADKISAGSPLYRLFILG